MLYMVEMDLADRANIAAWHAWYAGHIAKLLALPGFYGSQRFETGDPTPSPFLAIHDVEGPAFFNSAGYKAAGGPENTYPWQERMTNWYRNLFDGLERMPEVGEHQGLIVCEPGSALPDDMAARVTWLTAAGLDRTAEERGIVVVARGSVAKDVRERPGTRLFTPITKKFVQAP